MLCHARADARLDQRDRATAEASARESRAKHALLRTRRVRDHVEFAAAHFVVDRRRTVARVELATELRIVARAQRVDAGRNARHLGHDVASALHERLVHRVARRIEIRNRVAREVRQVAHVIAQRFVRRRALRDAIVEVRLRQAARLLGVHHEHFAARAIERHMLEARACAMQPKHVAGLCERRRELVHDPAAQPDVAVLGAVREQRELLAVVARLVERIERERRDDFDRRRRGQPGRHRQVAAVDEVEAARAARPRTEAVPHAERIVAPAKRRLAARRHLARRGLVHTLLVETDEADAIVVAHRRREIDAAVHCHRQHVAAVVVEVRADEVDATRREEHARRLGPELAEESRSNRVEQSLSFGSSHSLRGKRPIL